MSFRLKQVIKGEHTEQPPTTTTKWRAEGTPSPLPGMDIWDYVASYAMANIPTAYLHPTGANLVRKDMRIIEEHENYFLITVPYGLYDPSKEPNQAGAYTITVSQKGGTIHAIAGTLVAMHDKDGDRPLEEGDGGLIGVDGDEVHGVDLPAAKSKCIVRFRHPGGVLNAAYILRTEELIGHPNADPFLIWEPHELMYEGGDFTETDKEATAAYEFAISRNKKDFKIGDVTVTEKKGWDVLSVKYKDDVANGLPRKVVDTVQVIRAPGGREAEDYADAFGWGGP